jgi:hypothetical protein
MDIEIKCRYCGYGGEDLKIGRRAIDVDHCGVPSILCSNCGRRFVIEGMVDFTKKLDKISEELRRLSSDPKVIERGEELHKKLSRLTPEDLMREFTI